MSKVELILKKLLNTNVEEESLKEFYRKCKPSKESVDFFESLAEAEISNEELAQLVTDISKSPEPIDVKKIVVPENSILKIQKRLQTFFIFG